MLGQIQCGYIRRFLTLALLKDELAIKNINDLFDINLSLPSYQRPYKWSIKATNTLFLDTYNAYKEGLHEYRLGSIILHKENERYNIVDGQQRLTTLSILLYCLVYCLEKYNQGLLKEKYNQASRNTIVTNLRILSKRVNELEKNERDKYKAYLLKRCTVVRIVTDSEQDAFQFFDSQNSRGKELAPHDLLKSYHLREMDSEDEEQKIKIINKWESIDQHRLEDLFKIHLYPLTQWYKGNDGLGYSSNKIDVFKGINNTNVFNFALYHKASNIFVEQFNHNGSNELLASGFLNQFQLTQPLVAGKRFFNYTHHYEELLSKIEDLIIKDHYPNEANEIPAKRSGDLYILHLYKSILLFFSDHFGIEKLSKNIRKQLYSWSYSLRLTMQSVYPQTINKYALGKHERLNLDLNLFSKINDMHDVEDLKLIVLNQPENVDSNYIKYKTISDKIKKQNRWE